MKPVPSFTTLTDDDLLHQAHRLACDEREATAALIACLAEVDARRLYLGEGCSSLFAWCTDVLHLSGDAAYGRIEAARVARRYPIVLEALASGSVTMTVVALLRPHLTDANHRDLLAQAHHKSKRQIEQVVAMLAPLPDVQATIRRLPAAGSGRRQSRAQDAGSAVRRPAATGRTRRRSRRATCRSGAAPSRPSSSAASHRPVVAPLAPERYKIQFTIGRATHDKLRRAQDLLRHAIPNGDPAAIFDRALTVLITQLERQKWAAAARPRAAFRTRAERPDHPRHRASRRIPSR